MVLLLFLFRQPGLLVCRLAIVVTIGRRGFVRGRHAGMCNAADTSTTFDQRAPYAGEAAGGSVVGIETAAVLGTDLNIHM